MTICDTDLRPFVYLLLLLDPCVKFHLLQSLPRAFCPFAEEASGSFISFFLCEHHLSSSSRCLNFLSFAWNVGSLWAVSMPPLFRLLYQLPMLVAVLNLIFSFAHATPTLLASQLPSSYNDLSPRTQPLYNTAVTNHPKRAFTTRGTFYHGLWSLALTTATFLAQGPSSSTMPASDIESFALQIIDRVATRITSGATEKAVVGWTLEAVSLTFRSLLNPVTLVAPPVPWEVVKEFVSIFVLRRAQLGTAVAFSGNIWGPGGECVSIVLQVGQAASSILDSASEIHGSG